MRHGAPHSETDPVRCESYSYNSKPPAQHYGILLPQSSITPIEPMKPALIALSITLLLGGTSLAIAQSPAPKKGSIPNAQIDYDTFETTVEATGPLRENRRLTEAKFIEMLSQEGVILLDARSAQRYEQRHIAGAINLPFTEFTAETLAAVIPTPDTTVLIYCNNNFAGDEIAFAAKAPAASLNLSTYNNLAIYGYTNIYELGPLLDVDQTQIPFVGSLVTDETSSISESP